MHKPSSKRTSVNSGLAHVGRISDGQDIGDLDLSFFKSLRLYGLINPTLLNVGEVIFGQILTNAPTVCIFSLIIVSIT